MQITIEVTQEQAERLAKGESIEIKTGGNKLKEKWQPKGGTFYIGALGGINKGITDDDRKNFGVERETQQEAEYARDQMRVYNRLLAYVAEFDKDWKADWTNINQKKFFILFDYSREVYKKDFNTFSYQIGIVYMSEKCVDELYEKLNSGEVEL